MEEKAITIWCIILCAFGGISLGAFAYVCNHSKNNPQSTKYQAYYDGEYVNCNMMSMTKNCANLSDCDDKNSYFCVQNVKMFVDRK